MNAPDNHHPDDGLGQPNPSDEIVRRGQEALDRKRRDFDDWLIIGEALAIGRADIMREVHSNQPIGRRYEKAMAEWLRARGFHIIDKCTRAHVLECLQHRADIAAFRSRLTEPERFRLNHPTSVLRKWKAATIVPDQNAPPKPLSAFAKVKARNVELQEQLHRAQREIARGGGDLWDKDDRPEDIVAVMLGKLSASKAEKVFRLGLAKLKKEQERTRVLTHEQTLTA